jgi:hypothetical protein
MEGRNLQPGRIMYREGSLYPIELGGGGGKPRARLGNFEKKKIFVPAAYRTAIL